MIDDMIKYSTPEYYEVQLIVMSLAHILAIVVNQCLQFNQKTEVTWATGADSEIFAAEHITVSQYVSVVSCFCSYHLLHHATQKALTTASKINIM